jgi:hypothetical protein
MEFKPNYMLIYKNDIVLFKFLTSTPFYQESVKVTYENHHLKVEGKHFIVRCFRMDRPIPYTVGYRTMTVFIERELYDMMDNNFLEDAVKPCMSVYSLFGEVISIIEP